MKSVRIEFLSDGFHELLCSSGVAGAVDDAARGVATNATSIAGAKYKGSNDSAPLYEVRGPKLGGYGGGRVIAYVSAANSAAAYEAAVDHVLEQAVWAGGGM